MKEQLDFVVRPVHGRSPAARVWIEAWQPVSVIEVSAGGRNFSQYVRQFRADRLLPEDRE